MNDEQAERDIREILAENAKFWEDKRNQWKAEMETYWKDIGLNEHTNREQDTREKLEGDVRQYANPGDYKNTLGSYWEKKILSFLDRQAAITTAECTSEDESFCEACRAAQKRKIAELTAECDELQAAIDAMNNGQFYSMYKAKCEECEQLKKVVRTQAESFKKLECELAGKDG